MVMCVKVMSSSVIAFLVLALMMRLLACCMV